jgi:hypothetical protein
MTKGATMKTCPNCPANKDLIRSIRQCVFIALLLEGVIIVGVWAHLVGAP